MTHSVVLVRPWTDAHGGTGCCGGGVRDGICLDGLVGGPHEHDMEVRLVAETYLRVRNLDPSVDVQIVAPNNTVYLLPAVFRAVRRRRGIRAALRAMNRATTAGSVLIDGERAGDVLELGPDGVVAEVRRRTGGSSPE